MRLVKPFYLDLTAEEREEIQREVGSVLESGRLVLGPQTEAFENEYAESVGTRHAVATSTGTSALEMMLRSKMICGRKVAVPTNTNFATVAAVIHAGGQPVMLDMDETTFMPTADMLARAIEEHDLAGAVWVHIGGLIAPDFDRCVELCRSNGMFMFEDAAHAHASETATGQAGTLADGGAFSFFPTKVMTTLEGGMITTDDDELAALARSLRNQGKGASTFGNDHAHLGNSWRITEFSAAMGRVMLRKLPAMADRREAGARGLEPTLGELGLEWCRFDHMKRFSGYKLIVRVPESDTRALGDIKEAFKAEGVIMGGGVYDKPCHLQPVFEHVERPAGGFPVAEALCPRHLCPPITSGTTQEDVDQIARAFRTVLGGVAQPARG